MIKFIGHSWPITFRKIYTLYNDIKQEVFYMAKYNPEGHESIENFCLRVYQKNKEDMSDEEFDQMEDYWICCLKG